LRPARVWSAGEPVHEGWVVLTRGERIVAAGPASAVQRSALAQVIDLPGTTLLPGLMDVHSHLFLHPYNETLWDDQVLKEAVPYRTLRAGQQARATLLSGFTTLRDLGTEGADYADVSLKRAIEEGLIEGPRLFVVTRAIVATGAYGHCRGHAPRRAGRRGQHRTRLRRHGRGVQAHGGAPRGLPAHAHRTGGVRRVFRALPARQVRAHGRHAAGRRGFQDGAQGGSHHRLRERCRGLHPRHELSRASVDGA